jgi:Zn-dependent metalloprotease
MLVLTIFLLQILSVMISTTAMGSQSSPSDLRITRDPVTGAVTFLRSRQGLGSGANLRSLNLNPAAAARQFFVRFENLLGMPRSPDELIFKQKTVDDIGMIHIRLHQVYRGVPVYGAEVIVHYAADGKTVRAFNGRFIPRLSLDPAPQFNRDDAIAAVHEVQLQGELWEQPLLRIYGSHIDRRVKGNHLAWLVRIYDEREPSRNLYVVDAHSGDILTSYNELDTFLSRLIYDADNRLRLPGDLVRPEGEPAVGDMDADNAYDFLGDIYFYYWNTFDRDSYDNAGAGLIASVHYLSDFPNAFWNGEQMVFGDGFVVDDVTAHELTHAVTENEANLIYRDQSGALNESFSDIFGEFVDQLNQPPDPPSDDWLLGEDLPIGAIRDMSDPPLFNQPDRVSSYNCTDSDNGGVHINSGIPNKAAYLMAVGDTFNGYTVQGIDLDKTGQVNYRALTVYLIASSGFVDYYDAMNQSCNDLIGSYGITAADCTQVQTALLATEMNIDPECGGWATLYAQLLKKQSDLELLRRYRNEILMDSGFGILYTRLLYESSEDALEVLNQNPELISRAANLITFNIDAVSVVLDGGEGVIHNTDDIISFLQDYARKSSGALRLLANKVRHKMEKCRASGEPFLKFRLN